MRGIIGEVATALLIGGDALKHDAGGRAKYFKKVLDVAEEFIAAVKVREAAALERERQEWDAAKVPAEPILPLLSKPAVAPTRTGASGGAESGGLSRD